MRILEQKKIAYQPHSYVTTDAVSGTEVAAVLGQDPKRVFKTLVTVANPGITTFLLFRWKRNWI